MQFKPRCGNPGLELRTWGQPAVADCEGRKGPRMGTGLAQRTSGE